MTFLESLKIALRSLQANKMRSMLTMLGIIIGVASVIAMVALGSGAQTRVSEQIRSLGANVLMVMPGAAKKGGVRQSSGSKHTLTEQDAQAIGRDVPYVQAVAPSVRGSVQIIAGNKNWNTRVNGTTPAYFTVREWGLSQGRYFNENDVAASAKIVIVGKAVAQQLFDNEANAIGKSIRILSVPFTIVGVLAEKGPSGSGRNQDDVAFIPISTARLRLMGSAHQVNRSAVAYILVKARANVSMGAAKQQITALLRRRHRLLEEESDDFKVTNPAAAMAAQHAATRTIAWLLAAVASVSLLVGGISIMNIMLVSVTERMREVGLRMAVGARQSDIRNQFLMEAIVLCILGGIVGVLLGIGISIGVSAAAGWPIFISPGAIFVALAFSAGVGVFFGYYPARRAASMDPIACLRSECVLDISCLNCFWFCT
jgi:putative ABC transport system permease protein